MPSKLTINQQHDCAESLHVDATIMRSLRKSYFLTSTFAGHAGQVASVTFANVAIWRHVKSNIRVKYHEIVAWWSGVAYMYLVCVSLDIALIGTLQCACLPKPCQTQC